MTCEIGNHWPLQWPQKFAMARPKSVQLIRLEEPNLPNVHVRYHPSRCRSVTGRQRLLLNKLHFGTGQFKYVTVRQQDWLSADSGTVQCRCAGSLDMHHDKAVGPFGDGGNSQTGLADGGNDLDQGHFSACRSA